MKNQSVVSLSEFAQLALRDIEHLDQYWKIAAMNNAEFDIEGFDPKEWNIRREGLEWKGEMFEKRIYQAPEKIEFRGGIFTNERQRLIVLAMLLENLGIDKAVRLGNPEDWKAAVSELELL